MGLIDITDSNGHRWVLSQDALYFLLRTSVRAQEMRERSTIQENFRFFSPTTYSVKVDREGLARAISVRSSNQYRSVANDVMANPSSVRDNLITLIARTRDDLLEVRRMQRTASSDSAGNIAQSVIRGQNGAAISRIVRDASATAMVMMAGPVGIAYGGAAASAAGIGTLALGSAMRGTFTYQDTGNVGSAVTSTATTFTCGIIGLGPAAGTGVAASQQSVVTIVQSSLTGINSSAQAYITGGDVDAAILQGVSAAAFSFAGGRAMANAPIAIDVVSRSALLSIGGLSIGRSIASGAINRAFAPAAAATVIPPFSGQLSFGSVPANASEDAAYIRDHVIMRIN